MKTAKEKIEAGKKYELSEAVKLIKETSQVKFDAAVELHSRLNIDIQKSDQQVRGSVKLPHGTGKTKIIAAFVSSDKEKEAKAAGATVVGGEELIAKIQKTGKIDFQVVVATPDMMPKMAVIAKMLGQKGLMPNPKNGTITPDPAKVIKELNEGLVAFKNDGTGNVHLAVGRISFADELIIANVEAFLEELKRLKPEGIKGSFIKTVHLSSSMGPSIPIVF